VSKEFLSPASLPPPVGYSHIAKINKGRLFTSRAKYRATPQAIWSARADFDAQVEQVFRNLKFAVDAAGGTMADLVKVNYFLAAEVDQSAVAKPRAIRDRYLNVANPPVSTLVVTRLARPGWLTEIQVVAAIDD
jgi:enamine deaminase RidA (YjgF/YER057c/UK114 family)